MVISLPYNYLTSCFLVYTYAGSNVEKLGPMIITGDIIKPSLNIGHRYMNAFI